MHFPEALNHPPKVLLVGQEGCDLNHCQHVGQHNTHAGRDLLHVLAVVDDVRDQGVLGRHDEGQGDYVLQAQLSVGDAVLVTPSVAHGLEALLLQLKQAAHGSSFRSDKSGRMTTHVIPSTEYILIVLLIS